MWLDESGSFKDEALKKEQGKNGSLVGGILVREEMVSRIVHSGLLDKEKYHATELLDSDKREYVIPVLKALREEYGASQVFFENREYVSSLPNRQLYLRIVAEGLLQLMLRLNAVEEDIQLKVLIAQRQDMDARPKERRINEKEYIEEINNRIRQKKRQRRLILNKNSSLSFNIDVANRTEKLQFADFACNTRLTRDSRVFQGMKSQLDRLYEDAYVFSLSEISSENYINMCLAQGMLSDAMMEFYTTQERLEREKILNIIMAKMQNWSYRLVKSQLKQCGTDITGLITQEDDYEIGESILEKMNQELFPRIHSFGENFAGFEFVILLNLSDMYMREGDILAARRVLNKCGEVHRHMGDQLEHLMSYYQLQEKLALYDIDSFQYERAVERMEHAVESFQNVIKALEADPNLNGRFPHIASEYLGDAICMLLYAMMFQQRKHPDLYGKMCGLSDLAMENYPKNEGELERHRQYRSHIELENGKTEAALAYLMQAKTYKVYKDITKEDIRGFLNLVAKSEDTVSRQYYLMYYVLIMQAAGNKGEKIAEWMHEALLQENRLYNILRLPEMDKSKAPKKFQNKVGLNLVQEKATKIQYHPMEIVCWKYGSYLHLSKDASKRQRARHYLRAAENWCFQFSNYLTMRITGLGISAELIQMLLDDGKRKEAGQKKTELSRRILEVLALELDEGTREFVNVLKENYDKGNYVEMANLITY